MTAALTGCFSPAGPRPIGRHAHQCPGTADEATCLITNQSGPWLTTGDVHEACCRDNDPNYCPQLVAMFGVQRGEGAVQFASARSGTQGGSLTHRIAGLAVLSLAFVYIYMQKWSQMQHKSCSPLCGILRPFSPTYGHKWRGWSEGGQPSLLHGEVEGGLPPSQDRTTAFFSVLINMRMQTWSKLQ